MDIGLAREVAQRWSGSIRKGVRVASHYRKYAGRRHSAQTIAESITGSEIANARELDQRGFCRLQLEDDSLTATIETCRNIIRDRAETAPRMGKAYFAQLMRPEDLIAHPCLLQVGLHHQVLNILARTYGIVPYLESIDLLVSFPTESPALLQSQLWHIDRTDSVVVKQLIYIDAVGPDEGPFGLLPPHESLKVPSLVRHYLPDTEIARYLDLSQTIHFEGAAGARALVDTGRCFHYGSRVKKRRHALFYYYNTGYGKYKRRGTWRDSPLAELAWSPLQRQTLDLG
jgi:hypothetical protein